jgi:hypothetical protein
MRFILARLHKGAQRHHDSTMSVTTGQLLCWLGEDRRLGHMKHMSYTINFLKHLVHWKPAAETKSAKEESSN